MLSKTSGCLFAMVVLCLVSGFGKDRKLAAGSAEYTSDGRLIVPANYREWVYLASGFDMSYNPAAQAGSDHVFDNVFVNPEAYQSFLQTGTWPDKTMLVLENRGAMGKGSINQSGSYQGVDVAGLEVHVRDTVRFPAHWAFFSFDHGKPAKMIPQEASCYSCHAAHAAVDTTFVQFYPTLLSVAKSKNSFSPEYLKEAGAGAAGR